jgi:hypothetical protein
MPEPKTITAGNSATWTRSLPDYPASAGWALTYYLISPNAANNQSFTSTASSDDHLVALTNADTASWAPGNYRIIGRVVNGTQAATVHDCGIAVEIDPANPPAGYDPRSWAEQTLEAVEAALLDSASSTQSSRSVTVGNVSRTISEMSKQELLSMRNQLRAEVALQKRNGKTIKVLHSFART